MYADLYAKTTNMPIKIYLDSNADKEGRCQIFFFVSCGGQRAKISSKIKVHPDSWDGNSLVKSQHEPHFSQKDSIFQTKLAILKNLDAANLLLVNPKTPDEIKKEYLKKTEGNGATKTVTEQPKHVSFADMVADYQESYKNILASDTLRHYDQVVSHLEAYRPGVSVADMDYPFLVGYVDYLITEGLQNSTIVERHFKSIREISKEAIRLKLDMPETIQQIPNHLKRINLKSPRKVHYAPSWEEVEEIANLGDFVRSNQEHIRDAFIVSCHTGLRFSDINNADISLTSKQRGKTMLRVLVKKTGLDYMIPVSSTVERILKKYPDFKIPQYSNQEYNREIKHIVRPVIKGTWRKVSHSGNKRTVEEVPAYLMVGSHTARRCFGRRFVEMGGPLPMLMMILGHTTTETTLRYIGYSPEEIAMEYAKVFQAS